MKNLVFTQLSIPEVRKLFREEAAKIMDARLSNIEKLLLDIKHNPNFPFYDSDLIIQERKKKKQNGKPV